MKKHYNISKDKVEEILYDGIIVSYDTFLSLIGDIYYGSK